jgi:hypothetical protein
LRNEGGRAGDSRRWHGTTGHDGCVEENLGRREVVHDGGKGAHDDPIRSDAPNGAVAAVCQQPIDNTQLLTDRTAAEDGGMFVDVEDGV